MRQGFVLGKSAPGKQRSTCYCNITYSCKEKGAGSPPGFRHCYFISFICSATAEPQLCTHSTRKGRPCLQRLANTPTAPLVEDTSFLSWVQQSVLRNCLWASLLQADERCLHPHRVGQESGRSWTWGSQAQQGPGCRDACMAPGPQQCDAWLLTQPSWTTRYIIAGTSQISSIGMKMCLEASGLISLHSDFQAEINACL